MRPPRAAGRARPHGASWQTPEHVVGNGAALLEASAAQGLEGIMAKQLDSGYEPGRRLALLGQGQEQAARRLRHRRLVARGGQAPRPHRRAAGRRAHRGRRAALRRPGGHRLQRGELQKLAGLLGPLERKTAR
jgi:bifunctional non-homologous end joining protein LigD